MVEIESRDICIMKVGFISEFDVDNKKAWSGTNVIKLSTVDNW